MNSWRQSERWWKENDRVSAYKTNILEFGTTNILLHFYNLAFRLGKTISNCDYALLMPDYCTIPKCVSTLVGATGQTLSIEIKVCLSLVV